MAQGDYLIQNQSFPSFRSDLNSTLEAINTSNSGTSRPSSAVAGTVWLDTTNATNPTLKFFDGTDDISLAQLDYTANTVNWLDSVVSGGDVVDDTTPQLGGDLDVNGNSIVSVSNGNITFTPDGTGKVIIDGLSHPTADGTAGQFMKTDGAGNLSFDTVDLTNLSATNLTSGTVPIARLGTSGTKDATTFLRGDNTFAEAGGGAFKLLNTQTVTSSVGTVDFVNGTSGVVLDSTYKRYRFIGSNIRASAASNFGIRFRQGGSFISSTVYRMRARCFDDNNQTHDASNNTGMDYMRLNARSISNDAVETCMFDFTLNDLSNASSYTSVFGTGGGNKGNSRAEVEIFAGMITNTTTVDGVRFVLDSGTFESGDFSLYGIEA